MHQEREQSIAVIGCGYWGKNLARDFHGLGALGVVSDPNPQNAKTMAERYGIKARMFDEIMNDESIDGIVIAAPAEVHAELAIEGFEAGKRGAPSADASLSG
ncbi:MAG: Gfo/Idh/MocA family oxidoreductase [bacterium]|nr:Gfo/Idh/MocA family oxidoreductase [bacterium]